MHFLCIVYTALHIIGLPIS